MKIVFVFIFLSSFLFAQDFQEIFDKYNLKGSLIFSSLDNKNYVFNEKRVNKKFTPASTFKILHTLIALEENIVDENTIIKWDGKKRFYEPWNKDQTLQSAIKYSCVWCYQTFAQKISNKTYLSYLEKTDYGNKKTGKDKTTFWLDGDLKISALQQIAFLKKLYQNKLPFKRKYLKYTKKIITLEKTSNYTLKGKTGWANNIGWFVGYIKTKKEVCFFALNANISEMKNLYLREKIVKEALKEKKII
jgi:beta-lactamase class D